MDNKLDSVIQNQKRLKIVMYVIIAFLALVAYAIIILTVQFEQYTRLSSMSDLSRVELLLTPSPMPPVLPTSQPTILLR